MSVRTRVTELEPGQVVELVHDTRFEGPVTVFGRFDGSYDTAQGLSVAVSDGTVPQMFTEAQIRSLRAVDPAFVRAQFHRGQRVKVRKYGGLYPAVVSKLHHTRAQVTFTLRSGEERTATVPAWQLHLPAQLTLH